MTAECKQRPGLAPLYAAAAALVGANAHAGVLPEDRADVLYHSYQGGGITINGASVMARKKLGDHVSLMGNYYFDSISGASIDVVTQASAYKEKRQQEQVGIDILQGKTTWSAGYINSGEPDFHSKTAYASVSEDMFGDLTTVTFGTTRGWDKVGERGAPTFSASADRRNWSLGISQILTRNLVAGLNFEATESEGFLSNPYRQVRYLSSIEQLGYSYQKERYPHTRNGSAISGQAKYYLPWRAALDGSYRFYTDAWGIRAHTMELGYTTPAFKHWTLDAHARYYRQNAASFYSDLFPYADSQNFMARDRELAAFKSIGLGFGASFEIRTQQHFIQRSSFNVRYDRLQYKYDDYRDLRVHALTPGTEPLYTLEANVLQIFVSAWF